MSKLMNILTPDAFLNDWYGWLTNQLSHIALGVFLTFIVCVSYWFAMGEYPYRANVLALIATGYVLYEIVDQGWQGADTIEDSVFVTGYGASSIMFTFEEMAAGESTVSVDPVALVPFLVVAIFHLAAGVSFRLIDA